MISALDSIRVLTFPSVVIRMCLAMICGGVVGLERARKGRAAGFRTYMFVCMGAALAMIISQYMILMFHTEWKEAALKIGITTDASRLGAQVINGVGFLGAGTIIVVEREQVQGLTTAAGLWASACLGLAVGAGFYECVLVGIPLVFLCIRPLAYVENFITERSRNMDVYVEFSSLDDIGKILDCIKAFDVQILDIDVGRKNKRSALYHNAVLSLQLHEKIQHTEIIAALAGLDCVYLIDEV